MTLIDSILLGLAIAGASLLAIAAAVVGVYVGGFVTALTIGASRAVGIRVRNRRARSHR